MGLSRCAPSFFLSPSTRALSALPPRYMTINTPAKESERLKLDASVFGEGEVRQPRRVLAPPPSVPKDDRPMATRTWLKKYGLNRQRLSLEKFLGH